MLYGLETTIRYCIDQGSYTSRSVECVITTYKNSTYQMAVDPGGRFWRIPYVLIYWLGLLLTQEDKLARLIAETCLDEKALDVVVLDVHELTVITDYFVIASGRM